MIYDNNNQPRYAVLYCTGCHKSFKIKFPDGFDGHGYEPDFEYFNSFKPLNMMMKKLIIVV